MFIGVIVNTIGEVMVEVREEPAGQTVEEEKEAMHSALHTQPDHLAVLGGELLNLKAQLDRIEKMLQDGKN
jgi:hypothetical protein